MVLLTSKQKKTPSQIRLLTQSKGKNLSEPKERMIMELFFQGSGKRWQADALRKHSAVLNKKPLVCFLVANTEQSRQGLWTKVHVCLPPKS